MLTQELETVTKQFQDKLNSKDEQVQKYALILSEERNEKRELQAKLDNSQNEVKKWINRFYLMIIFFICTKLDFI